MAFAKAFAEVRDAPLIGVHTLACEAFPYIGLGMPVRALVPMGRDEFAVARFRAGPDGDLIEDGEPSLVSGRALAEGVGERTLFCGEGAANAAADLRKALGDRAIVQTAYGPGLRLPGLVALAHARLSRGESDDRVALQPAYLRRPTITPSRRFIPGVTERGPGAGR
jgi:tRNA A37 threonylcarbamoyladenosine modification protein TsaB